MARARLTDHLAINKFQLLDVSFSLPMVLLPLFGFRSVSFPQLNLTYKQVKEGNYEYPRFTTVERAELTPIILEQGVSLLNSDFWDWVRKSVTSQVSPKNLLLIQFTQINPVPGPLVSQAALSKIPGTSSLGGIGLYEDGARIPGKAWMLYRCRPLSYKPGTDLDAMSGEISLATLEIQPEELEEISIGI